MDTIKVGGRVVAVDAGGTVPVGSTGTVVSLSGTGACLVRWDGPVNLYALREELAPVREELAPVREELAPVPEAASSSAGLGCCPMCGEPSPEHAQWCRLLVYMIAPRPLPRDGR